MKYIIDYKDFDKNEKCFVVDGKDLNDIRKKAIKILIEMGIDTDLNEWVGTEIKEKN